MKENKNVYSRSEVLAVERNNRIEDTVITLRLRGPNTVELTENISNQDNRTYMNDTNISPWPSAVVRPSLEEVRESRIRDFSPHSDLSLATVVADSFFQGPFFNFEGSPVEVVNQVNSAVLSLEESRNISQAIYVGEQSNRGFTSTHSERQTLINVFNQRGVVGNTEGISQFQNFGASSINVPRRLSRHELVISFFFSLMSNEAHHHMATVILGGSLSATFVLFIFRRIFVSILNPSFWASIRTFEISQVLDRALRNSQRLPIYGSLPTTDDVNAILVRTNASLDASFRAHLRGFRRGNYFAFFMSSMPVIFFGIGLIRAAGGFNNLPFFPGASIIRRIISDFARNDAPVTPTQVVSPQDYARYAGDLLEIFTNFFIDYF